MLRQLPFVYNRSLAFIRHLVVCAIIIITAAFGYSPKAANAVGLPNGFRDLVGTSGNMNFVENYLDTSVPEWENVMIREPNGIVVVFPKTGVLRLGFYKIDEGFMNFGGYANNDNGWSNNNPSLLSGWCLGSFYDSVLADGDSADGVMVIHDQDGDGIGSVDGGIWYLGDDDILYQTKDIEFNGVQGDLSQLGTFTYGYGAKILPPMTIDARPPRNEPAGINELESFADYWLSSDCSPEANSDCAGADWNYDGNVNYQDFAIMNTHWDPNS